MDSITEPAQWHLHLFRYSNAAVGCGKLRTLHLRDANAPARVNQRACAALRPCHIQSPLRTLVRRVRVCAMARCIAMQHAHAALQGPVTRNCNLLNPSKTFGLYGIPTSKAAGIPETVHLFTPRRDTHSIYLEIQLEIWFQRAASIYCTLP